MNDHHPQFFAVVLTFGPKDKPLVLVARDERSRDEMTIGLLVSRRDWKEWALGSPKVETKHIREDDLKAMQLSDEIKPGEPGLNLWRIRQ